MTAVSLSKTDLKKFRTIGHGLKPVVTIAGNGLAEAVMNELHRALNDHELIKVRVHADDREDRNETFAALCEQAECQQVQVIGNVALLYKKADKPNPKLSNILRANLL